MDSNFNVFLQVNVTDFSSMPRFNNVSREVFRELQLNNFWYDTNDSSCSKKTTQKTKKKKNDFASE